MCLSTMHSLLASGASVAMKRRNERSKQKIAVFKVQMGFLATFQNKATGMGDIGYVEGKVDNY